MFSNRPTKKQLHKDHEEKIASFLAHGGTIQSVPPGASSLINGNYNNRHIRLERPHKTRTAIPEVVAAIEARRTANKKVAKPTKQITRHKSVRKVVLDDFGEPVRVIWSNH